MDTEENPPSRQKELLVKAADDLDAGGMLLNGAFLDEHGVTAAESHIITQTVTALIRGYLRLDPELQAMVVLLGVDTSHKFAPWIVFNSAYTQRSQRRMKSGEDQEENYFPEKK